MVCKHIVIQDWYLFMFDKLGMIENFGTGISRTIESYKNYDVKPEFKATENFFFVTLPNINYASNGSINDSINDPISDPATDPISDLGLEITKALKVNYSVIEWLSI